jgi:chorismate dehydratase
VSDAPAAEPGERLGIVAYTNVAPLHWGLSPWPGARFYRGVPTDLNKRLIKGELDLTLISSAEFIRHRHELVALPDFSIAARGAVRSVTLFHKRAWGELDGARIAVSNESATSVALLRVLLNAAGMKATFIPHMSNLARMLAGYDAALLIGDSALEEGHLKRAFHGSVPQQTDLGEAWLQLTGLPFVYAVWAARRDQPPSPRLVAALRAARDRGLADLPAVAAAEAAGNELPTEVVHAYLANFRYFLDADDRAGLLAFAQRLDPSVHADELQFITM